MNYRKELLRVAGIEISDKWYRLLNKELYFWEEGCVFYTDEYVVGANWDECPF